METFNQYVWPVLEPLVTVFLMTVVPVLTAQLVAFFKVNNEVKKAELEKTISEALHRSIANGLKAAMVKFNTNNATTVILNAAADYVTANNPDAIKRFEISGKTLNEMILSKVPDVLAGMQK